jgi:hypothetical protein
MTRFAVSLFTVLAVLAAPAMYGEVTVNESQETMMMVYIPCAANGAGEMVQLSGRLHVLMTFTINGNNVSGKYHFQPQGISGVGMTTGSKYQATGVTQNSFKGSLKNGVYAETYVNNFRIIGQGPGNNFLVHENMRITIDENGVVTVVHDNFSVECK